MKLLNNSSFEIKFANCVAKFSSNKIISKKLHRLILEVNR